MQLMLVNTVRKVRCTTQRSIPNITKNLQDLESASVARICLALQYLIAAPTEYVVPAVQSRVQELISHNSSVGSFYSAAGNV